MMMNSKYIYQKANSIVRRAGTRDPKRIASELGIEIYYNGNLVDLLGLYTLIKKKRAIVLNNRLEDYMLMMVLAHEIGHDALHREYAKNGALQEFELFNMNDLKEYEANAFAAHLLLDTDEVLDLCYGGADVASIASEMCVNINLVLIKINELIKLGYDLRMPLDTKKDFLKDIRV